MRRLIAPHAVSMMSMQALANAAPIDPRIIKDFAEKISERFVTLDPTAPMTKPIWTPIVSHAASEVLRLHTTLNWGMTAVAENHVVIERMTDSDSIVRIYQRLPVIGSSGRASKLTKTLLTEAFKIHPFASINGVTTYSVYKKLRKSIAFRHKLLNGRIDLKLSHTIFSLLHFTLVKSDKDLQNSSV